jgi:hypothetical protein
VRPRELKGRGRRGLSGLGLVLVLVGLLGLAVAYAVLPPVVYRLWPLLLVGLGLFGLLRRPGWVRELDLHAGPEVSRAAARPQRIFSWFLVVLGLVLLVLTLGLVDQRILASAILIALGVVLLWRRAR